MQSRRRVRVLTFLALFLATAFGPTQALGAGSTVVGGTGVQTCDQAFADVWEHNGYNGDGLRICFAFNISDLSTIAVLTGDHICTPNPNGNWNNCISAAQFHESGVNTTACLYTELNYIGQMWKGVNNGDQNNWIFPPNDWASSFKFGC